MQVLFTSLEQLSMLNFHVQFQFSMSFDTTRHFGCPLVKTNSFSFPVWINLAENWFILNILKQIEKAIWKIQKRFSKYIQDHNTHPLLFSHHHRNCTKWGTPQFATHLPMARACTSNVPREWDSGTEQIYKRKIEPQQLLTEGLKWIQGLKPTLLSDSLEGRQ